MTLLYSYASALPPEAGEPLTQQGRHVCLILRRPQDVYSCAQTIAGFLPQHGDMFFTGIYELLLNAIEHGNLAIGQHAKQELIQSGTWLQEVHRRLAMPQYRHKTVRVEMTDHNEYAGFTIADMGEGFDWRAQLDANRQHHAVNSGGLWIAQHCGFDHMTFNAQGNCVTCYVRKKDGA